jgi:hypothetical protein
MIFIIFLTPSLTFDTILVNEDVVQKSFLVSVFLLLDVEVVVEGMLLLVLECPENIVLMILVIGKLLDANNDDFPFSVCKSLLRNSFERLIKYFTSDGG